MSIERKILFLVLGIGVLWSLLMGGLSYSGMAQVQKATEGKGDEMLAAFDDFAEEYAESLIRERLLEQAQVTALQVSQELGILDDAENIGKMAEKILEHPEDYAPRHLSEAMERTIAANKAYIYYSPGVREELATQPALAEKFALLANITDTLEYLSYFYAGGSVCYLASEDGCFIRADAAPEGQTTLVYDEASFLRSYDFRERPWYIAGKQTKVPMFTDVYESTAGKLEMSSVMPFYDHGEFAGVVGVAMTLESLHSYITAKDNDIDFVTNRYGQIIISSREDGVLSISDRFTDLRESPQEDLAAVAREMTEGKNGTSTVMVDGKEYYLVFMPIPNLEGYSCAALTDKEAALAPTRIARETVKKISEGFSTSVDHIFRERISHIGILFGIIFIALIFISGKMAHKFVRPILILTEGVKKIAMGNLDTRISVRTGDEIEALSDSVNAMATDLKSYIAHAKESERIEGELEGARKIQAGILPNIFPEFGNLKEIDLHASMTPAKEVGGDFYDFYWLGKQHLVVTIADVSGKGIPASLFMVISKAILKKCAMTALHEAGDKTVDWGKVMEQANVELCENNEEDMFVTVFFGVLDLTNGDFAYVNAGHNPPLICRDGKFEYLRMEKRSNMLGLLDFETYREYHLTLVPSEMLFLYTDGVTEAMNEAGEMYSEERLQKTLNTQGEKDVKEILAAVREDVGVHTGKAEQSDDITMLGLRFWGERGENKVDANDRF